MTQIARPNANSGIVAKKWKCASDLELTKVSSLWQRSEGEENVSRRYNTSRPLVTTPNEDWYLAVASKRYRRVTASDLSHQPSEAMGDTVSRQTMYRRLGHIGLQALRPVKCVTLTATHSHQGLA
ncbi:ATP-binding cassette sub-family A member 3 [Trichonephila clavipes]|nr:ATP-binding cassette sub-family A member 3 [Trichonephila clavipes]